MLIGYAITAAVYTSLILMLAFALRERKELKRLLQEHTDRYTLITLALTLAFFLIFSLLWVSPVEQLYFDENIYQGIALNILNHANALWCQFGTGYVRQCYINALYHDPVGWSAFIAIAFAIFGIGTGTAYGLELLSGALSIVCAFLLASLLFKRRSYVVLSTLSFALMPQLFIWSRTQADVDLAFMMFATLTFFLFVAFTKRKSLGSLALFAFSLDLVSYMRVEAILLVPIFCVLMLAFSENGVWETLCERISTIRKEIESDTRALLLLLAFVLLLLPQIYYIALEAQNPSYGQGVTQSVVSFANFRNNTSPNVNFLLGQMNGVSYYPMAFHYTIVPLAMLGVLFLVLDRKRKNGFGIILLLGLWFIAYFLFYTAFYAGAATFGVDSRFMLQLLPASCLLAAFGVLGIGEGGRRNMLGTLLLLVIWVLAYFIILFLFPPYAGATTFSIDSLFNNQLLPAFCFLAALVILTIGDGLRWLFRGNSARREIAYASVLAIATLALLVYPFIALVPIVTLAPSEMPQQTVILKAANTFYENYTQVPSNCLVFSFTNDVWEEFNRSSIQIGFLNGANSTIKQLILQYKCLALDYGYWCVVPPYHSTLCSYIATHDKLQNFTSPGVPPGGYSVTFYRILNYS